MKERRSSQAPMEVPASEVKNAWHEFVDLVSRGRQEVIVTKYGRPIMKLVPVDNPAPKLVGLMAGTLVVVGDIVEPLDEVWESNG
jgi:prevent-host-death family protein